jgi:transposase
MNKEMFIDILRHLRIAVRKTCSEKHRTNNWIFLHNNAPAHRSVLCEDFLTKKNMTTLDHPPYSPEEIYQVTDMASVL